MAFFVLTPIGLAGPYKTRGDARVAAAPLGYPVIEREADYVAHCRNCRMSGPPVWCEPNCENYLP